MGAYGGGNVRPGAARGGMHAPQQQVSSCLLCFTLTCEADPDRSLRQFHHCSSEVMWYPERLVCAAYKRLTMGL